MIENLEEAPTFKHYDKIDLEYVFCGHTINVDLDESEWLDADDPTVGSRLQVTDLAIATCTQLPKTYDGETSEGKVTTHVLLKHNGPWEILTDKNVLLFVNDKLKEYNRMDVEWQDSVIQQSSLNRHCGCAVFVRPEDHNSNVKRHRQHNYEVVGKCIISGRDIYGYKSKNEAGEESVDSIDDAVYAKITGPYGSIFDTNHYEECYISDQEFNKIKRRGNLPKPLDYLSIGSVSWYRKGWETVKKEREEAVKKRDRYQEYVDELPATEEEYDMHMKCMESRLKSSRRSMRKRIKELEEEQNED